MPDRSLSTQLDFVNPHHQSQACDVFVQVAWYLADLSSVLQLENAAHVGEPDTKSCLSPLTIGKHFRCDILSDKFQPLRKSTLLHATPDNEANVTSTPRTKHLPLPTTPDTALSTSMPSDVSTVVAGTAAATITSETCSVLVMPLPLEPPYKTLGTLPNPRELLALPRLQHHAPHQINLPGSTSRFFHDTRWRAQLLVWPALLHIHPCEIKLFELLAMPPVNSSCQATLDGCSGTRRQLSSCIPPQAQRPRHSRQEQHINTMQSYRASRHYASIDGSPSDLLAIRF